MLRTLIILTFVSYAVGYSGCTIETSDDYDPDATEYDGVCIATKGVVKTCTSNYHSFCYYGNYGAINKQYYAIIQNPESNCAIEPTNGVVDLSVLDTQGLPMYIGQRTFYNCAELTSIVLPESVEGIGYSAFYSTGLTELTIPKSVKFISPYGIYQSGLNINLPTGDFIDIKDTYTTVTTTTVNVGYGSSIGTIKGCKYFNTAVSEDICPFGCTDSNYLEYNASAVLNDGSCATYNMRIIATDCQAVKGAFRNSSCCTA